MRIGFIVPGNTALPMEFRAVAEWARAEGFDAIDPPVFASGVGDVARATGLTLGCSMVGIDLLSADDGDVGPRCERLCAALQWAAEERVGAICIHTHQRVAALSVRDNVARLAARLEPVLHEAERCGVDLVMENWPADGANVLTTPEVWEVLLDQVPSPRFGVCLDPSHLVWLGIDEVQAARSLGPRVRYAHAKDTELFDAARRRYGIYGPQIEGQPAGPSWRYRIPGFGAVRWPAFLSALYEAGYEGVLSIEHEDPVFWGTQQKVLRGLRLGQRYLRQYAG